MAPLLCDVGGITHSELQRLRWVFVDLRLRLITESE
jgi:hypothetical protein